MQATPLLIKVAHSTFIGVPSTTSSLVLSKTTRKIKSCASFFTFVRLSFTMNSLMLNNTPLTRKGLTSLITFVRFLSSINSLMYRKEYTLTKCFLTILFPLSKYIFIDFRKERRVLERNMYKRELWISFFLLAPLWRSLPQPGPLP
uniref:Uncharacterized protein n=1 Tax=Myotis myotis TaxID=51298 RepID=A0A7J7RFY0_MYOMY|nr:hypothetical protein mMyoMyo1_010341 [Myotis myotis]